MITDWLEWHRHYDDPNSPLVQRLALTHHALCRAFEVAPGDPEGVVQLVSICAGEGRDVLPVLANDTAGDPAGSRSARRRARPDHRRQARSVSSAQSVDVHSTREWSPRSRW